MDADGTNPAQLTDPASGSDTGPAWSPDGSRIAFISDRDESGNLDVYTMAADGSDVRRLTTDPEVDADAVWTPAR